LNEARGAWLFDCVRPVCQLFVEGWGWDFSRGCLFVSARCCLACSHTCVLIIEGWEWALQDRRDVTGNDKDACKTDCINGADPSEVTLFAAIASMSSCIKGQQAQGKHAQLSRMRCGGPLAASRLRLWQPSSPVAGNERPQDCAGSRMGKLGITH
jgi:hypothetical protein